ncbi:hypothetical protein [Methylobacter marinus]|uniref:hypothetical protein n=1 Tax=Methylobacter marinus TaxID=34058 RepID=UPI000686A72E|nr:hypothetical protein [Methylobacter marinus]
MANVVVAENHLTFGGVGYFRGHAEEVELGSIGEKRTPLTKQNYLEVKDRIPAPKIDVAKATAVDIDFSKTSKSAFNTVVSAIIKGVPVKLSGDATFDKLRSGSLKLVKFSVLNNDMKKAANNSPQKLQSLIEWGNDARIAHQVFVVMEASLANQFDNNIHADLSVGAKGLEATVGGGSSTSGTTSVRISKGTCFAYLLARIDWDAKLKKNRTKIVDLDDDQWSFG